MWLITDRGFFSVVSKPEDGRGILRVRARSPDDLELLREAIPLGDTMIMPGSDYTWHAKVDRDDLAQGIAGLVREIGYSNFKARVKEMQGPGRAHLYLGVWAHLMGIDRVDDNVEMEVDGEDLGTSCGQDDGACSDDREDGSVEEAGCVAGDECGRDLADRDLPGIHVRGVVDLRLIVPGKDLLRSKIETRFRQLPPGPGGARRTWAALARATGMDRQHLPRKLARPETLSLAQIVAMARYLHVDPAFFMTR